MRVIIRPRAQKSITNIAFYIAKEGYPETAIKFINRLEEFIYCLNEFPEKFQTSRHKAFAKRQFRQVSFAKNYIIVYKMVDNELIIFNIIHARRIH